MKTARRNSRFLFLFATFSLVLLLFSTFIPTSRAVATFSQDRSVPSESIFTYTPSISFVDQSNYELVVDYRTRIPAQNDPARQTRMLLKIGSSSDTSGERTFSAGNGSLLLGPQNELIVIWGGRELVAPITPETSHEVHYVLNGRLLLVTIDGAVAISNNATDSLRPADLTAFSLSESGQTIEFEISGAIRDTEVSTYLFLLRGLLILCILALVAFSTMRMIQRRTDFRALDRASSRIVSTVALVILVFTLLSVIGLILGTSPYQLGPTSVRFSDMSQLSILAAGDPYEMLVSNYPPFGLLPFRLLGLLPDGFMVATVLSLAFGTVSGVVLGSCRTSRGILGWLSCFAICINFPVLLAVDRGNIDLVALALTLIGLFLFLTPGPRKASAAVLLGFAAALKVWPVLFASSLANRRRNWVFICATLAIAAGVTLLAGYLFGLNTSGSLGKIAQSGDASFLPLEQRQSWAMSLDSLLLVVSDLTSLPFVSTAKLDQTLAEPFSRSLHLGFLFLCVVWALLQESVVKKFLILSAAIVLFSPVSFSYRGMLFLIPLTLMLLDKTPLRFGVLKGLLLGLLLAPVGVILLLGNTVTLGSLIHPVAAAVLLVLLAFEEVAIFSRTIHERRFAKALTAITSSNSLLILISVLLIAVIGIFGVARSGGSTSWRISPEGSTSVVNRAIVGLGGTEASISPMSIEASFAAVDVYFPASRGQVNCPAAAILFSPSNVVVKIEESEMGVRQTLNFSLVGSSNVSLRVTDNGSRWTLFSGGTEQIQFTGHSVCLDVSHADLNVAVRNSFIDVSWGRNAGLFYYLCIAVSLVSGGLALVVVSLRRATRKESI